MNRIVTEIKKPRRTNSQADNEMLFYRQRFQNSKKLDISEFKSMRCVIFSVEKYEISNFCPKKSHISNFQIEKSDISNFELLICSGRACSPGGVKQCVM